MVVALSRALKQTDEELYDAVPRAILELIANFVPFREFQQRSSIPESACKLSYKPVVRNSL